MSPVYQTNEWDDEKCQVRVQECLDLSTEPTLSNSLVCGDAISQTWPAGALLCANRSVQWRYESSIRRVPGASHSQAVLVEVPGSTLYVAGQGDVTGDFEIQARKAWTQIEVLLNEAGMTLTDVVKVTGYVVDRNYVSAYRAVFLEVMGEVRPASTLVICDLVHPAMLVEIEIVATKN